MMNELLRMRLFNNTRAYIARVSLLLLAVMIFGLGTWQERQGTIWGQTETKTLTAGQILERVGKTYANCKSYRDSGTVKRVSKLGSKNVYEYTFDTLFVRPDRFRFELTRQDMRATVWRKGDNWRFETKVSPDLQPGVGPPPEIAADSVTKAIGQIAGYSGFTAHSVPLLLLPKIDDIRFTITEMTDAKRIEDAKLDKADCFRLTGKEGTNKLPLTLWIDKKTFLIRRIDRTWKTSKRWTEATTSYDPQIDVEIPEKMLEFHREEK